MHTHGFPRHAIALRPAWLRSLCVSSSYEDAQLLALLSHQG